MQDKKKTKYTGKGQAGRLIEQHERSRGAKGIFGEDAQKHDASIGAVAIKLLLMLQKKYPHLEFRRRKAILKQEIHAKLRSVDKRLGKTLFVKASNVQPDGGITEVKDNNDNWRVILVGESKHQGNDIRKIQEGIKQGKFKDQDLMVAGNAIERVHKNILEIRNMMISEHHFPYVVFLQGTNFATETVVVKDPTGRKVTISHEAGGLNRIDRVTASNFGMKINTNHCKNIQIKDQRLQVASFYSQCDTWLPEKMLNIMLEIAETSLEVLQSHDSLSLKR